MGPSGRSARASMEGAAGAKPYGMSAVVAGVLEEFWESTGRSGRPLGQRPSLLAIWFHR